MKRKKSKSCLRKTRTCSKRSGKALEGKVKKVELTSRLKSHPCCLRAEGPVTLEMEKVLNQQAAVNGGESCPRRARSGAERRASDL